MYMGVPKSAMAHLYRNKSQAQVFMVLIFLLSYSTTNCCKITAKLQDFQLSILPFGTISSPESLRYSKLQSREDSGTRCKILHEWWCNLSRETLDVRLCYTFFLGSNMVIPDSSIKSRLTHASKSQYCF